MSGTQRDSVLRLADELRDLAGHLSRVADELLIDRKPEPAPVAAAPPPPHLAPPPPTRLVSPPPAPTRLVSPPPAPPPPVPAVDEFWDTCRVDTERALTAPPTSGALTWDLVGSRSLAWLGGAVTVLGVVLLLILAVQEGLLGPGPRLLAGIGLAGVLLAAGAVAHRKPAGQAGAFALCATGFATLYADAVAATSLYGFLPDAAGLVGALVVAATGLLLADRWGSEALAVFVVLAAAAGAPIITGLNPLLSAFLLVLAVAATPVRLRRNWRYLAVAAAAPPLVTTFALTGVGFASPGGQVTGAVVVALVTVVGTLALAIATVLRNPADPVAVGLLAAAPVPVIAAAGLLSAPVAAGALAAVAVPLVVLWAIHLAHGAFPSAFAGTAGIAAAVVVGQATVTATVGHGAALPIALLCQSILLALVARVRAGRGSLVVASVYGLAGVVLAVIGPVPPAALLLVGQAGVLGVPALVVSAAIVLAAVSIGWSAPRQPVRNVTLGLAALYGYAGTVLSAALLVWPGATGFRIGQVVITVSLAAGALVLLARGARSVPARIAGLAMVGAAVLKLGAFDLETLDGIVRVSACLGAGVVLLVAGVRYARVGSGP
jgi:hypothetical protein